MFDVAAALETTKQGKSLGSRLAAAREGKGLAIEKAAHDTRIRVQRLREIENDDLSHFTHPTYARLFLVDYAKYLGVTDEVRSLFPETGACGVEGYQYLQEAMDKAPRFDALPRPSQQIRLRSVLLTGAAAIVCIFIAVEGLITWRKLDRVRPSHAVAEHIPMDPSSFQPSAPSVPPVSESPSDAPKIVAPSTTTPATAAVTAPSVSAPVPVAMTSSTVDDAALLAAPTPAPTAAVDAPSDASTPVTGAQNTAPAAAEHKEATPLLVGGSLDHGNPVR